MVLPTSVEDVRVASRNFVTGCLISDVTEGFPAFPSDLIVSRKQKVHLTPWAAEAQID